MSPGSLRLTLRQLSGQYKPAAAEILTGQVEVAGLRPCLDK